MITAPGSFAHHLVGMSGVFGSACLTTWRQQRNMACSAGGAVHRHSRNIACAQRFNIVHFFYTVIWNSSRKQSYGLAFAP